MVLNGSGYLAGSPMDLSKAQALFDLLAAERGCFLYSGTFGDSVSVSLIALAEGLCASAGRDRGHRQRLAFVMVEAYQNVVRHRAASGAEVEQGSGRSAFVLRMHADSDEVLTINPVTPGEEGPLETLLGQIGKSDLAQLKALFLARLKDGGRTLRGGAGLGLIEMARKSANGLVHGWLPLAAGHRSLLLQMRLGQGLPEADGDDAMRLLRIMDDLGVLMACRCGSSSEALQATLRIVEGEPDGQGVLVRALLASAAWLAVNGLHERAMLAVVRLKGEPVIVMGLRAPSQDAEVLVERIGHYAAMVPSQRDAAFKRALLLADEEAKRTVDLLELMHLSKTTASVETLRTPDGQLLIGVPLSTTVR